MSNAVKQLTFVCKCGKKLQAPETYAGRQAKCPACRAVVKIPALAGDGDPNTVRPGASCHSTPQDASHSVQQRAQAGISSLLAFLDNSKGTDELYEMLRTRSAAEMRRPRIDGFLAGAG